MNIANLRGAAHQLPVFGQLKDQLANGEWHTHRRDDGIPRHARSGHALLLVAWNIALDQVEQ